MGDNDRRLVLGLRPLQRRVRVSLLHVHPLTDDHSWRRMRKAAHEAVNKVVAHGVDDYLISDALALARSGLQNAQAWDAHLHRASASSMLSCLYGEPPVSTMVIEDSLFLNNDTSWKARRTLALAM